MTKMLLASLALTAALALFANRVCGQVQCSTAIETFTRPYGTLAADADDGQPILPNIYDPQAVKRPKRLPWLQGFYNVYGDDVESLNFSVQYHSADRLHVEITPTYIGHENQSGFVPPADVMRAASLDTEAAHKISMNDLYFTWGNSPSFWIKVMRNSNSDVLLTRQTRS